MGGAGEPVMSAPVSAIDPLHGLLRALLSEVCVGGGQQLNSNASAIVDVLSQVQHVQ